MFHFHDKQWIVTHTVDNVGTCPITGDRMKVIPTTIVNNTMGTINAESCAIILTSPSIPNLILSLPFYAEQKRNSKHDEKGTIFIKGESAFFVFSSIMPAEYIYAGRKSWRSKYFERLQKLKTLSFLCRHKYILPA